jgi:hypothetical protein
MGEQAAPPAQVKPPDLERQLAPRFLALVGPGQRPAPPYPGTDTGGAAGDTGAAETLANARYFLLNVDDETLANALNFDSTACRMSTLPAGTRNLTITG